MSKTTQSLRQTHHPYAPNDHKAFTLIPIAGVKGEEKGPALCPSSETEKPGAGAGTEKSG
jgi:hypothetical protein